MNQSTLKLRLTGKLLLLVLAVAPVALQAGIKTTGNTGAIKKVCDGYFDKHSSYRSTCLHKSKVVGTCRYTAGVAATPKTCKGRGVYCSAKIPLASMNYDRRGKCVKLIGVPLPRPLHSHRR